MKVIKYSLGQLQANCYFIIKDNDCLIIDPGDEVSFILEELQRRRLKLVAMLATHGHFDHLMAAGEIQKSFNVPLYINKKDRFLINRLIDSAEHFLGHQPLIIKPTLIKRLIKVKNKITDFKFQVITTPGHSPGSVCFYFKKEKVVFTGDTLHKGTIGRFDHSYCNKKDLKNSLITLSKLPEETKVYPGHEEETTIKEEKNNLLHYINIL
ncbi:hypothetical protein COW98_05185 [Candidatus Roizmanbacteria bacterium CG22_combo_CG10-13_8_21_14_all_35_9]|uniref:Metallo-beta-lactamase domain-containing protein n=1 Tax=Candidatus Roizmanbacteria bacterium CG22_combo_CG10-13_8_21_14_all_35_9 TaxID=1974861 RepID=A0A2H0BX03_9BACT|nr:MAG: hypothetical protein COW98_05185 [Candidatus Roizmanbacteria bacterium CG22_combo_CG10-13_8_21_14_all_35_9]